MTNYKYSALRKDGRKAEGTYEAESREEVVRMLKDNSMYPINIEEQIDAKQRGVLLTRKVKVKEIAIFCRQFHTMLHAGVSIVNCLDILKEQTQNKRLRKAIADVYENVQKGHTFSDSLQLHKDIFPELLIYMVEAGEVSGSLDTILDRMAIHYTKEYKIENKIKGAMTYPIILAVVSVIVVTFMLAVVFPSIIGMFVNSNTELPLPTVIMMTLSSFVQQFWWLITLIAIALGVFLKFYHNTESGRLRRDRNRLRNPLMKKMNVNIAASRFTRTLSTLLSSGVPLIQALEVVGRIVGNRVVEKGLEKAREDLKKGSQLAPPLRAIKVFPPMMLSMVSIGEESGALDDILNRTADFYDEEVEAAIEQMMAMIEPIMIVVMATVIGFIVVAMMMPILTMINTLDF